MHFQYISPQNNGVLSDPFSWNPTSNSFPLPWGPRKSVEERHVLLCSSCIWTIANGETKGLGYKVPTGDVQRNLKILHLDRWGALFEICKPLKVFPDWATHDCYGYFMLFLDATSQHLVGTVAGKIDTPSDPAESVFGISGKNSTSLQKTQISKAFLVYALDRGALSSCMVKLVKPQHGILGIPSGELI